MTFEQQPPELQGRAGMIPTEGLHLHLSKLFLIRFKDVYNFTRNFHLSGTSSFVMFLHVRYACTIT
jgi:hypothetical protein